ncbi:MAG: methyltransferase domain-containing protein [Alphaproteobacteria bacterium]|nr:methyltransferase domain-containing protein [Alphaproteobacteria bacterium]
MTRLLYAEFTTPLDSVRKAERARSVKEITECRACGSKALTPAFSLPASLSQVFEARGVFSSFQKQSTDFVLCDMTKDAFACGLLQSAHYNRPLENEAPSGRFASVRHHLRAAATEALELISGRDCAALDIGCNDGALLSYYPRWVDRFGVDPSERVEAIGEWAWTARAAFPSAELDRAFGDKKFDIITAISVFERVDEPRAFLARVKSLLSADGVFVLETLYAPMTLTRTAIEPVIGAASAVYSLAVLERLARDSGLKIFRGGLTDKEGGSVRLFLTHADVDDHDFDPWYERLARLWDEENALALRLAPPYQAFERRAEKAREDFIALLERAGREGDCAHLLGTGAQSAALLAWAGRAAGVVTAAVGAAGDAPLGRLDVISETESRAAEPGYLIVPAALKREMLERWREAILLGARMIVASPEPHVIHAHNYVAELAKTVAVGDGSGGVETLRAILSAAGGPRLVADNASRAAS